MAISLTHYRFGINELAESTHGWHANEDTNPAAGVIAVDTTFLLRFTSQCDGTALSNVDCEFQVRKNGGAYQNITTSSTIVKAVAATPLTNGGNCTKRLSGTGTFESSGAGQTTDGTSGGTANDIVANGNSETECGLQIVGTDVVSGDVLDFRLTRDGGTLYDTYSVVPSLTVAEPVSGSLNSSIGNVTLSATGTVAVQGSLSSSVGDVTLSATGTVAIAGALSSSIGDVTLVATGTVETAGISGSLSSSIGDVTLAAAGAVAVQGSLSASIGDVGLSGAGAVAIQGSLSQSIGTVTLAGTGAVAVTGALNASIGDVALSATGTVGGGISGALSQSIGDVTLAGTGVVPITGALSTSIGNVTLVATGTSGSGAAPDLYDPDDCAQHCAERNHHFHSRLG